MCLYTCEHAFALALYIDKPILISSSSFWVIFIFLISAGVYADKLIRIKSIERFFFSSMSYIEMRFFVSKYVEDLFLSLC